MDIVERLRQGVGMNDAEDVMDAERAMDKAADVIERLREAALPFAEHDWMDAELEDDSCKLTRHSGKVTVGHWRALRTALTKGRGSP